MSGPARWDGLLTAAALGRPWSIEPRETVISDRGLTAAPLAGACQRCGKLVRKMQCWAAWCDCSH